MSGKIDIAVTPLPMGAASGAAVRFPWDAGRNARFRERFPAARWSEQTRSWLLPGRTAAQRATLWAAEELAREAAAERRRQDAEMERAWADADPAAREAAIEEERRREAARAAAEAQRRAALQSRYYRPDPDMIARVVDKHLAMVEADEGRLAGRYMVTAERLRDFLAAGVAPGASARIGRDMGGNLTVTYLGDGRLRRVVTYPPIRGRNGLWQEVEIDRQEMDAPPRLMERMLSCLAWHEFKPRGGFGVPKVSRR